MSKKFEGISLNGVPLSEINIVDPDIKEVRKDDTYKPLYHRPKTYRKSYKEKPGKVRRLTREEIRKEYGMKVKNRNMTKNIIEILSDDKFKSVDNIIDNLGFIRTNHFKKIIGSKLSMLYSFSDGFIERIPDGRSYKYRIDPTLSADEVHSLFKENHKNKNKIKNKKEDKQTINNTKPLFSSGDENEQLNLDDHIKNINGVLEHTISKLSDLNINVTININIQKDKS